MICNECGCEYNERELAQCPACLAEKPGAYYGERRGSEYAPLPERSILDLVTDASGQYVRDLDRRRCSTCLRRLSCQLVSNARKAKPGQLIAGLVVEERNLRCRQYKYAGGNRRPASRRAAKLETPKLI
jgi:hypothetical protein